MKQLVIFCRLSLLLLLCLNGDVSDARPIKAYNGKKLTCLPRVDHWKQNLGPKRCKRACKSDADCHVKPNRICVCDGQCGLSCVHRNARCPYLMELLNGEVKSPQEFTVGVVATFGCNPGYTLVGSAERRCQGNKHWSGIQPICRPNLKCGRPPEWPNAYAMISDEQIQFSLEDLVNYTCENGYWRHNGGLSKAKCLSYNGSAQWFGPNFVCVALTCGNPGTIINGRQHGRIYQYMSSVTYTCNEGYKLTGSKIRTCQADRSWSGTEPKCEPIQCDAPPHPLHGSVQGASLDYLSKVTYICNKGYRSTGQSPRVCGADGHWTGQEPKCEEIKCNSLPGLENGHIQGVETHFGAVVTFSCSEGAILTGQYYATCTENGTWDNKPPNCLAACNLNIKEIKNGAIRKFGRIMDKVEHNHQIEILCNEKYELKDPENPKCINGKWTHSPECIPVRCNDWPINIKNGYVMFINTAHNATAKYVCKPGFELKGNEIIHCLYGEWQKDIPTCDEVLCRHPNDVGINLENGVIKLEGSMGTYEYKSYIKGIGEYRNILFECNKGYVLRGPRRATCVNATWAPAGINHHCDSQRYTPLEETEWEIARPAKGTPFKAKRSISYEHGERNFTATSNFYNNGQQTSPSVSVQQTLQPKKSRNFNRNDEENDPNAINRNENFFDENEPASSHNWKSNTNQILCPPLVDDEKRSFANIRLNPDNFGRYVEGSRVMVQCKKGYELSNAENAHLACINGTWSPSPPLCEPKTCRLPNITNAFFVTEGEILNFEEVIVHGSGATIYCLRGFELMGNNVLECNLGKWLKRPGKCKAKPCLVPYISHGYYTLDPLPVSVVHETVLKFKCDNSHFPNPSNESNQNMGEVYCNFGDILPHSPECNREEGDRVLPPESVFGCRRPVDIEKAWIYKETRTRNGISMGFLIDPFLAMYPNNTVVHYKCHSTSQSDQTSLDEASSVKCINGDWYGMLTPCADPDILPLGVHSNNSYIMDLQINGLNLPCKSPNLNQNSVVINGENKATYNHGSQLMVQCKFEALHKWLLKCHRGKWTHEKEVQCALTSPTLAQKSCIYNPVDFRHVYTFYKNRGEPLTFKEQLPEGSELLFRCVHVGAYQFMGSKRMKCENGTWKGSLPHCRLLSIPWKEGQAPAILYRARDGDLSLSNSGEIIARKSSLIEIDCVLPKNVANPRWDQTNNYRMYPQLWANATIPAWEVDLSDHFNDSVVFDVFRLTIYMARPEDSGIFFCVAPSGKRQSVNIKVTNIDCSPLIVNDKHLTFDATKNTSFGSLVHFMCPSGYDLTGNIRIYCLENGEWSNSIPKCSAVICPPLTSNLHPALTVNITSSEYLGHAIFKCAAGFTLQGAQILQCTENRTWNERVPTCRVTKCFPPDIPPGAKFRPEKTVYSHGEMVSFYCESGYMLSGNIGQDFAQCNDGGQWSNSAPNCNRFCRFPGTPAYGRSVSVPHDYYFVHDRLAFQCMERYSMVGIAVLKCLPSGQWSNDLPKCVRKNRHNRLRKSQLDS